MFHFRFARTGLLLAAFGFTTLPALIGVSSVAHAADEPVALRPDIGKSLQAAQELIKAKNYKDALAKIQEADSIAGKNALETETIERLRGAAAYGAGDTTTAARSFELLVDSGHLPAADQAKMLQALASIAYQAKEYTKSADWAARALKQGGGDAAMHALMMHSHFLAGDYASAQKEVQEEIQAAEKAGNAPTQQQLQILANCTIKQNDKAGYAQAIEKLVAYYPTKKYWADLLSRVQSKPGFADRLSLDVLRLKLAAEQFSKAAEYMEMSQMSLQAGFPAEAVKVVESGYKAGALGSGAEAERQQRLRELVRKNAADDLKTMAQGEAEATKSKDGNGLVNLGYAYVTAGQFDKGIALMEQGISKGGMKRIEDAKLHMGIAYLQAGKKAEAVQILKTVQGVDGTADLARCWILLANRPAS